MPSSTTLSGKDSLDDPPYSWRAKVLNGIHSNSQKVRIAGYRKSVLFHIFHCQPRRI